MRSSRSVSSERAKQEGEAGGFDAGKQRASGGQGGGGVVFFFIASLKFAIALFLLIHIFLFQRPAFNRDTKH